MKEIYTKKELKKIKKIIKRTKGQVFSWCDKCKRVSLHTFRGKGIGIDSISNLLYCFNCEEGKT